MTSQLSRATLNYFRFSLFLKPHFLVSARTEFVEIQIIVPGETFSDEATLVNEFEIIEPAHAKRAITSVLGSPATLTIMAAAAPSGRAL